MKQTHLSKYLESSGRNTADTEQSFPDLLEVILERAVLAGASDVHIVPMKNGDSLLFYRIAQTLICQMRISRLISKRLSSCIQFAAGSDLTDAACIQEGSFRIHTKIAHILVRFSSLLTLYGQKIVLRIFDSDQGERSLETLGFLPRELKQFQTMISKRSGLILITGGTGSGKSTTCFSALRELANPNTCVISIEDPIEYPLSMVNQFEVRKEGFTFQEILHAALRQDPDIIFFGEIRDREGAQAAVSASMTGHLVISTIHCSDVFSVPLRLTELGADPTVLPDIFIGAVAQQLTRSTKSKGSRLTGIFELAIFDRTLVKMCLKGSKSTKTYAQSLGWVPLSVILLEKVLRKQITATEGLRILDRERI